MQKQPILQKMEKPADLSKIRALCIDVDNTLLDFNACAAQSIQNGFRDWNIPYSEKVFSSFLRINNQLWDQIERQEITFDELQKIRWKMIFEDLGLDLDGPSFEKVFRHYLSSSSVPVEGALDAVQKLAEKYPLFVITNGDSSHQADRVNGAGMLEYFEDFMTSDELKVKKPDPLFFSSMLDRIQNKLPGIEKEQILIIGDSVTADMEGGHQSGFPVMHFGNPDCSTLECVDYQAEDWDEVLSILL